MGALQQEGRDVVLKITTEGSSGDTGRRDTYQELLLRAFGAAVQNLLADYGSTGRWPSTAASR